MDEKNKPQKERTMKKPLGSNRLRASKLKPSRPTRSKAEPPYGKGKKPKPYARY